jgi:hypothetical protein
MTDEFEGNTDDLIRQMQLDELHGATKLSPVEYARMRGMKPQLVYYHLRTHGDPTKEKHIQLENCQCGRKVVDVKLADAYFEMGEFDPNYVLLEED